MNSAIHDGFDLGWKLGWVLRGWAGPALLDSYERERRPVVEHNVVRSADPNGSHRDVGRRAPHRPRRAHRARLAAGADRTRLDARPARTRPHALHRAGGRGLGERRRGARRRAAAARRALPRPGRRARAGHPSRRCAAGPARRRTGRMVAERRRLRARSARRESSPARAGRGHSPSSQRHDTCRGRATQSACPIPAYLHPVWHLPIGRVPRYLGSAPSLRKCSRGGSTCSV